MPHSSLWKHQQTITYEIIMYVASSVERINLYLRLNLSADSSNRAGELDSSEAIAIYEPQNAAQYQITGISPCGTLRTAPPIVRPQADKLSRCYPAIIAGVALIFMNRVILIADTMIPSKKRPPYRKKLKKRKYWS